MRNRRALGRAMLIWLLQFLRSNPGNAVDSRTCSVYRLPQLIIMLGRVRCFVRICTCLRDVRVFAPLVVAVGLAVMLCCAHVCGCVKLLNCLSLALHDPCHAAMTAPLTSPCPSPWKWASDGRKAEQWLCPCPCPCPVASPRDTQ